MNPFLRSDWKRSAKRGGCGWSLAGVLLIAAIIKFLLFGIL